MGIWGKAPMRILLYSFFNSPLSSMYTLRFFLFSPFLYPLLFSILSFLYYFLPYILFQLLILSPLFSLFIPSPFHFLLLLPSYLPSIQICLPPSHTPYLSPSVTPLSSHPRWVQRAEPLVAVKRFSPHEAKRFWNNLSMLRAVPEAHSS